MPCTNGLDKPEPWKITEQILRSRTLCESYSKLNSTFGNQILYFLRLTIILRFLRPIRELIKCKHTDLYYLMIQPWQKKSSKESGLLSSVQKKLEFISETVLSLLKGPFWIWTYHESFNKIVFNLVESSRTRVYIYFIPFLITHKSYYLFHML